MNREQLEGEREALLQERAAAEHAAQPTLIPIGGGSYTGQVAKLTIGFRNAGADATNAVLIIENEEILEKQILAKGESIQTIRAYANHEEIESLSGYIVYFDARGEKRARRFTYPLKAGGGPNGRNTLGEGTVEATLYKPPFPWEGTS